MTGLKRSLDETEIECNLKNNLEVLENEQGATVISEGLSIGIDNIPGPDESIDSLDQIGTASNDSSELGHQCNISSIISQETLPEVSEMEIIAPTTGPQHKTVHKKLKIKNPASVWMIFSNENRDLIYKEFPLMNFTEGLLTPSASSSFAYLYFK